MHKWHFPRLLELLLYQTKWRLGCIGPVDHGFRYGSQSIVDRVAIDGGTSHWRRAHGQF
jgi:hypothetical protein